MQNPQSRLAYGRACARPPSALARRQRARVRRVPTGHCRRPRRRESRRRAAVSCAVRRNRSDRAAGPAARRPAADVAPRLPRARRVAVSAGRPARPRRARIDLLPHQLEPALAVVSGLGSRLLLADEVGLGKTIQAALVVAELRARDAIDRVLVLTPAGLREQWAGRTGRALRPSTRRSSTRRRPRARRRAAGRRQSVDDRCRSRLRRSTTSSGAEVLPAVAACRWDVLIVDEAHGVAPARIGCRRRRCSRRAPRTSCS